MTLSNRRFIRLPPDGAGKRAAAFSALYLEYNARLGEFTLGDTVVGATTAVSGHIEKIIPASNTTGELLLHLDEEHISDSFLLGEDLLINNVVVATAANTGTDVYYNEVVLVSGDNPANKQYIDPRGAQYTTFSEGSPRLDAFGKLRVSQASLIGNYALFTSMSLHTEYSHTSGSVASTCTYMPSNSLAILQVDSAAGSEYTLTSNRYHTYLPGIGLTITQTVISADSGKSGLVRRWGYFDDTNGLFWEQSGSVVNVVIRNNGVDTSVKQADWNADRVNGTGHPVTNLSKFSLDLTKNNIYTIDFQWLGAGRVRFGIVSDHGESILCHEIRNANSISSTYMGEGSLPIRYQIKNLTSTAGTSELKVVCATVHADIVDYESNLRKEPSGLTGPLRQVTASAGWTYYFSGRAGKYDRFGKQNHTNTSIVSMTGYASAPMVLEVVKSATLTNPVWAQPLTGTAEVDTSATGITGGTALYSTIVNGVVDMDITRIFSGQNGEQIRVKSDINAPSDPYSIRLRLVSGSTPADALVTVNWLTYR